jgi:hypothetical protein
VTFKSPRAAAIAGVVFAVLLICSLWLLQTSIPATPVEDGAWLRTSPGRVSLALNLIPFAGVAFMWFLGVLRDRLGALEDRLFATVFLGSGLLFLGMLFVAASSVGGLVLAFPGLQPAASATAAFAFGRSFAYSMMHIYAFKMAAVFMVTTSTVAIRTRIVHRRIAYLGYLCAAFLLFSSDYYNWSFYVFPCWVMLVSLNVLARAARA